MNQLDLKLYELFSKKELSDGCYIKWEDMQGKRQITKYHSKVYKGQNMVSWKNTLTVISDNFEIIGYEPQLHDVFKLAAENKGFCEIRELPQQPTTSLVHRNYHMKMTIIPYNPTQSLLNQSNETKQQLIDLFTK